MYKTLTFLGISVLSLVVIGFIVLASAGENNSLRLTHNATQYLFLTRQGIWIGVSFCLRRRSSTTIDGVNGRG